MTSRFLVAALVSGLTLLGSGCAKSPTDVLTTVYVDPTVPPLLILQVTVSSSSGTSTGGLRSIALGDAADRPAAFTFPMVVTVNAEGAGSPATITIKGLDWDTQAVVASGSTTAQVVADHDTQATLTLTAAPPGGGGDGGTASGDGPGNDHDDGGAD